MPTPVQQPTPARIKPYVRADRRAVFLARLAECGRVSVAAEKAAQDRPALYRERSRSPEFAALWEEALSLAMGMAEDELYRRAVEGWDEPVFQRGAMVGTIRKFSDSNLQFYLKAADPAKYREVRGSEGLSAPQAIESINRIYAAMYQEDTENAEATGKADGDDDGA